MAFITPFVVSSHPWKYSRRLSSKTVRYVPKRACWTSLAKSHPYGDGGIPQEVDWTGYDPVELKKEIEEAERLFKEGLEGREDETPWAIVMSADIIQWDNNLFEASKEHGFNWDLSGVNVVRMSEQTARTALPSDTQRLWAMKFEPSGLLTFSVGNEDGDASDDQYLLAFETNDEAVRFADGLAADGYKVIPTDISILTLKSICKERTLILGVVPAETLVSSSLFTSGMK